MSMSDTAAFSECRDCYCQGSRSAARAITAVYDRHLRPHRLRSTQFTILTTLVLRGPTPITALAKSLGTDRTTLTRNLSLLETKGWVQVRLDGADARSRLVSVTSKGRAVAHAALPAWREAQTLVARAIGAAGATALHRLANTRLT
jgi:DNA-binding MarR family transcriptional regulator